MTLWYDIASPRNIDMATKVETPLVEKKKATVRPAKKPTLEEDDIGDDRQPNHDSEEAEVLSDEGMSDDIVPEDCEGGHDTSVGSSSEASHTSLTHADVERIIEEGQTKIGKLLLAQQDAVWEKRLKRMEAANSKLLDVKLGGLQQELKETIDTRIDARLSASEARMEAMIATANEVAEEAKKMVDKVQKQATGKVQKQKR